MDTVIHKNGNKEDCNASNLAWRTRSYAIHYHKQFAESSFYEHDTPIEVIETGAKFDNVREASINFGIIHSYIALSALSGEPAWPINQTFRYINFLY
jgi:hypothetical protein